MTYQICQYVPMHFQCAKNLLARTFLYYDRLPEATVYKSGLYLEKHFNLISNCM